MRGSAPANLGQGKEKKAPHKEERRAIKLDLEDMENLREVRRVVCTCGLCKCR